jgi:heme-degrading monooxygenase HmoA
MVFHPSIPPPFYVCIFSNQHAETSSASPSSSPATENQSGDNNNNNVITDNLTGYAELAHEIHQLARHQDGYLGMDSSRNDQGFGVTVSYWNSDQAMKEWKRQADHVGAQRLGRERFYADYHVHIAKVERSYCMERECQEEE